MANAGGTAIGRSLNYGYPGQRSRGLNDVIENRPVQSTDTNAITFGAPVVLNPNNTYSLFTTTSTTLSAALTSGTAYTSLSVAALVGPVLEGDSIVIGANGQTVTASATANIGATAISVTSFTANAAYAIGAAVAASNTFAQFAGVAVREVKQSTVYFGGGTAQYNPGDPCDVIQQGSVIVTCQNGTPAARSPVYIRTALNSAYPNAVIGGWEAAADGTNSVLISNAQWKTGLMDTNNSAEVTLLTRNNA
jgi:hypothetical protein